MFLIWFFHLQSATTLQGRGARRGSTAEATT